MTKFKLWRVKFKGEIFAWNTNQVVNTIVFFNFKRHLQKAIFDKIKTDMAICGWKP